MKTAHGIHPGYIFILSILMMFGVAENGYCDREYVQYAKYLGHAVIESDGRQGVINSAGEIVITPVYDLVSFPDHDTIRVISGGKWGLFDCSGQQILPPEYDYISSHNSDGFAYYVLDNKIGFIKENAVYTLAQYELTDNGILNVLPGISIVHVNGQIVFFSGFDEQSNNATIFMTDYTRTSGYDVDAITAVQIDQENQSYRDFVDLLYAVYSNTVWGNLDENHVFVPLADLSTLTVYPYFERGITMHDYGSSDSDGRVIYMNPYGEVLQSAPMIYKEAWELWDMNW